MAEIVYDDLLVCDDCAAIIANGTLGAEDEAADITQAVLMVQQWGEDTRGLVLACDPEDEDSCEEFSTRQCDGCGSTLAGGRHKAAVLR